MTYAAKHTPHHAQPGQPRDAHGLAQRNEQLVRANRDLSALVHAAEQRAGDATKFLLVVRGLVEARDGADAWRVLDDLLVNVVGTEDFAVLVPGARSGATEVVAGRGPLRQYAEGRVAACEIAESVLLRLNERVVGAILIGGLLSHKPALSAFDRSLLAFLSEHGAALVQAAALRGGWQRITARPA